MSLHCSNMNSHKSSGAPRAPHALGLGFRFEAAHALGLGCGFEVGFSIHSGLSLGSLLGLSGLGSLIAAPIRPSCTSVRIERSDSVVPSMYCYCAGEDSGLGQISPSCLACLLSCSLALPSSCILLVADWGAIPRLIRGVGLWLGFELEIALCTSCDASVAAFARRNLDLLLCYCHHKQLACARLVNTRRHF